MKNLRKVVFLCIVLAVIVWGAANVLSDDIVPEECREYDVDDIEMVKECADDVGEGPSIPTIDDRYNGRYIYLPMRVDTAVIDGNTVHISGQYGYTCSGSDEYDIRKHGNRLLIEVFKMTSSNRSCSSTEQAGSVDVDLSEYKNVKTLIINDSHVVELGGNEDDD